MTSLIKCLHCGKEHSPNLKNCPACREVSQSSKEEIEAANKVREKTHTSPCRVCGEVLWSFYSDQDKQCPNCGEPDPIREWRRKSKIKHLFAQSAQLLVAGFLAIVIASFISMVTYRLGGTWWEVFSFIFFLVTFILVLVIGKILIATRYGD